MLPTTGPIDLLVIGGGTAGIVGSLTAARLGATVVLAESARTGGDCLWTGCVPSKTLLAAARAQRDAEGAADYAAVRARVRSAVRTIEPHDAPETLRAAGVEVVHGPARFTGPRTAVLGGRTYRFRAALIATGATPARPSIPGLESARTVSSETVWDLEELPGRLVVIGGGPVGCELGQAYARLGSTVTVLARSRLLPREDRQAAALVQAAMTQDGAAVVEHATVTGVETRAGTSTVHLSGRPPVPADVVLVATGRTPRTGDLGLVEAGVACDPSGGVVVDGALRTSVPGIWAAGDVTHGAKYTHLAGVQASVAASNAVLGLTRRTGEIVPRVTFTDPELAAVGVTTATRPGSTAHTVEHATQDRAITEGSTTGFTRLVLDRRGRVLGGTVVGPRAGESIGELTLAVHRGLSTTDLAAVTHPYPTYNDGIWNAAIDHAQTRLDTRPARAAIVVLRALARRRAARRDRS